MSGSSVPGRPLSNMDRLWWPQLQSEPNAGSSGRRERVFRPRPCVNATSCGHCCPNVDATCSRGGTRGLTCICYARARNNIGLLPRSKPCESLCSATEGPVEAGRWLVAGGLARKGPSRFVICSGTISQVYFRIQMVAPVGARLLAGNYDGSTRQAVSKQVVQKQ